MLSNDEIVSIAQQYVDSDQLDTDSERVFSLMVDAARTYVALGRSRIRTGDDGMPVPPTFGGVNIGWAAIEGLIENLEMQLPDDEFRQP